MHVKPLIIVLLLVCHAAVDAIVNRTVSNLSGCTMYLTHTPDKDCAQLIVESGICEVIYINLKHPDKEMSKTTKELL